MIQNFAKIITLDKQSTSIYSFFYIAVSHVQPISIDFNADIINIKLNLYSSSFFSCLR